MATIKQPSDFQKLEELLAKRPDAAQPLSDITSTEELGSVLASRWYITSVVKPVIVDLVAEFAGQEKTALDGDSLLMLCYETAAAMSPDAEQVGVQPLVATYLAERYLLQLVKAKLNFTIVWFEDRAWINLASKAASSKRFARCVIQSHLKNHCADIPQAYFSSISSPEWRRWLELERPYAILATDGASSEHGNKTVEAADTYAMAQHISGGMGVKDLAEGVSVALISNDMFEDHKILCFLIVSTPLARHAIKLQAEGYQRLASALETQQERYQVGDRPHKAASWSDSLDATPAENIALLGAENPQASEENRIALLLQALLLKALPLDSRALNADVTSIDREAQDFLAGALDHGTRSLSAREDDAEVPADLIDPRLFAFCVSRQAAILQALPQPLKERLRLLCQTVGISDLPGLSSDMPSPTLSQGESRKRSLLLPYQSPADLQLPELSTRSDAATISEPSTFLPRLSATGERSLLEKADPLHFYNRPGRETKAPRDAHGRIINKLQAKQFRANQRYASWVTAYAQSLLGSSGLIRQAITEGPLVRLDDKKAGKPQQQPKQPAAKKLSKKEQIIAQNQKDKSTKASAQVDRKLTYLVEELQIGSAVSKFDSADLPMVKDRRRQIGTLAGYIAGAASPAQARDLILLRVRLALEAWVAACSISDREKSQCFDLAVMCFTDIAKILSTTPGEGFDEHERALLCSCGQASRVLGVQSVFGPSHAGLEKVWDEVEEKKGKPKKGEFAFDVNWPKASKKYSVGDPLEFQLKHCGDVMTRELDSKEDRRVTGFKPDAWQRDVLDAVDARDDTLVVAPTSAGKTFIAFYCVEKALRESSDAVVVYIAPSKALVNQIAAELEARYTKNYGTSERTIWAISSGDFDVHNPLKAQVLVASPSVLHKMCLNTEVAASWLPRVKTVIMDEIHSLTDLELGPIWQQLLAFVPCPIIALSATVGNVDEFGQWLKQVREQQGQKVAIVQHSTRYSDLKKHVYVPASSTVEPFKGISKQVGPSPFLPLHPFTALRPAGSTIPSDLEMTPAEQLQLVRAMQATSNAQYQIDDSLDPGRFFANIVGPVTRANTLAYQEALRAAVKDWMARDDSRNPGSPFLALLDALESGLQKRIDEVNKAWPATMSHIDFQRENLLPFLGNLENQKLMPALLFDFNRDDVETLGMHLVAELVKQEDNYKAHNKAWQAKLEEWDQWKTDEPDRRKAEERKMKALKGKKDAEAAKKDARATDVGWQASFDPDAPLADFTFANEKCGLALEDIVVDVEKLNIAQWMKDGLIRGVAIHHVSLPTSYRQIVERWYRKGWLRVVICTGSLALGINMPARTSVFVGDHTQLDALQYRQAAGRAGRRGMDLTGNVVFYGIPWTKVQRLLTSKLPALDCDLPTSATLYLRLHQLLADPSSRQAGERMAKAAVRLENPPSRQEELPLAHQFRVSVEFLRRFGVVGTEGQPLTLAGITSYLASNEPANLAFVELLRSGTLYNVAFSASVDRVAAVDEMVVILSHLFASRKSNPTRRFAAGERPLPPLPQEARKVLGALHDQAVNAYLNFTASVKNSAEQVMDDSKLPLSAVSFGGSPDDVGIVSPDSRKSRVSQSSFAAMAGSSEALSAELGLVQAGSSISHRVVPFFERILDPSPKNAYVLDFFRHGHLQSLSDDSGLPGETFAWAALNDFWHVLLSLRSVLEILLKTASRSKGREGTATGASSEADWEESTGFYYDEEGDADPEDDAQRTDSGIAGSQMSGLGAGASGGKVVPVSQGPDIRTKSGKKVDPIKPPIEVPNKHHQLYAVYEMIVDIQRNYHGKFFKTFA
ncbi:P-loop containing nucleoside triphosphate hydrolase protein [Microstroma glucosiphilum]|uniref:P-loop containing nucleoside triphosphate hydrolase protein n=1 Tax=Pseudomicrostroma glucosiphilum TaxID=1684307 RepID=A0A316U674_9BASI|nr:P-loop containing nucleoside triphosphate hydrolase protein [Pseudomicrostroma glucosiphilum]PWN20712.1 P-loop containing nucleoside triphosphate hydrolase protein [Pseudomicrostroma glucosiphilum]